MLMHGQRGADGTLSGIRNWRYAAAARPAAAAALPHRPGAADSSGTSGARADATTEAYGHRCCPRGRRHGSLQPAVAAPCECA